MWLNGRKNQSISKINTSIWFHFASLGEFEQGRPVLEQVKKNHPDEKIVITFFSPSGYEIRKNTPLADYVYYLPLDTKSNVKEFIHTINPAMAIFTKYEYWYHYYNELNKRSTPLYLISGIFRPNQIFFKWYGGLHRRMLSFVTRFFLQDDHSKQLLETIGITEVTVSGDTRFDRVWANAKEPRNLPIIREFKNQQKVFVAGSTWPPDEALIVELVSEYPDWKFIIAPHEIGEEKVNKLTKLLPPDKTIKYSQLGNSQSPIATFQCLLIDNIGMLSALYQYGEIAYIGGGFGVGIHNTLEAAAFGLPVIFGPNYKKFKEAKDLIGLGAGFSVSNTADLKEVVANLVNDDVFYHEASKKIKSYVNDQKGATQTIIDYISSTTR